MTQTPSHPVTKSPSHPVTQSPSNPITITNALTLYLTEIAQSRSPLTHRAYSQALRRFSEVLTDRKINPSTTPISQIEVEWMAWFIETLRGYAVATEQLYLTALSGFYEYVAARDWATVNLPALKHLRRRHSRREAARLPPFPREEIEKILETAEQAAAAPAEDEGQNLRLLRDRAILFVLADTGLRVAELCSLTRGHMDWNEARAVVLGKGEREAVVRFSPRSLRYLRAYLSARADLDGAQGRPLSSLPLFARHDRGAGKRVLPLSPRSVEKIVRQWAANTLGHSMRGDITPHTFRHYFVTIVLRGSGGNIRLAQELARHRSITTTQRYTHLSDDELDRGYSQVFDE